MCGSKVHCCNDRLNRFALEQRAARELPDEEEDAS